MSVIMGPFTRAWLGAIGHHDKRTNGDSEIFRYAQDDSGRAQDDSGRAQDDNGRAQDDRVRDQDHGGNRSCSTKNASAKTK